MIQVSAEYFLSSNAYQTAHSRAGSLVIHKKNKNQLFYQVGGSQNGIIHNYGIDASHIIWQMGMQQNL